MIRGMSFAALMTLAGCDQGLSVCEEHIKDGLRSPSTYHRIGYEVRREEVPIPRPSKSDRGLLASITPMAERLAEWKAHPTQQVYRYTVESDAANAYGVPVRDKQSCVFTVDQVERLGNLPFTLSGDAQTLRNYLLSNGSFRRSARMAYKDEVQSSDSLSQMGELGKMFANDTQPDCCVN